MHLTALGHQLHRLGHPGQGRLEPGARRLQLAEVQRLAALHERLLTRGDALGRIPPLLPQQRPRRQPQGLAQPGPGRLELLLHLRQPCAYASSHLHETSRLGRTPLQQRERLAQGLHLLIGPARHQRSRGLVRHAGERVARFVEPPAGKPGGHERLPRTLHQGQHLRAATREHGQERRRVLDLPARSGERPVERADRILHEERTRLGQERLERRHHLLEERGDTQCHGRRFRRANPGEEALQRREALPRLAWRRLQRLQHREDVPGARVEGLDERLERERERLVAGEIADEPLLGGGAAPQHELDALIGVERDRLVAQQARDAHEA